MRARNVLCLVMALMMAVSVCLAEETPSLKDDFYAVVNAEWLEQTEIPSDAPEVSVFSELGDQVQEVLKADFQAMLDGEKAVPEELTDFIELYRLAADYETRNALGAEPLKPYLERIEALDGMDALRENLADLMMAGMPLPFGVTVMADMADASVNALYMGPCALFLSVKDYYLDDATRTTLQGVYGQMSKNLLVMAGKTEEEAVRKALTQLGLERDDVSLEILERAKSGFLGIGGSPARIRVTYGTDEPEEKKAEPAKKVEKKPEPKAEVKKPEVKPEPKKQEPKKPETKPVEKAPEQKPVTVGTCDDDNARRIREFLEGLLQHMNSPAQVNVVLEEKGRYQVTLEGEKLGQLIGRRGETLDAIQQLTNYAVNSGADKRIRVHVDAENYRAKREQSLESLARKVAAKVTKYRRSVTLEPMNAYERHVIHAALQDEPGITTYSIGSEPNRRVVVSYDREKRQ